MIKFFKWLFRIKDKETSYPDDFCIIEYSPIALQNNILNDQNKIIYRYFSDGFGNTITKKYRYSLPRLKALQEVYKVPVYDKTKEEKRFPVYSRVLPSEVEYTS